MVSKNLSRLITSLLLISILTGCGTARGILFGAGSVFEGVATDAKTIGNWIK